MRLRGRIETRVGIFVLIAIGILIYMGFHIGAFRFDKGRYALYTVHFEDVSGLTEKSEVRIAGVKVGWVEGVNLVSDKKMHAEIKIMVLKAYSLYDDSHAIVRQDGLLGTKFIEIVPGDPLLAKLRPGDSLGRPSVAPVNIDDVLQNMKKIASNVEDITKSFRSAVGGVRGEEQLNTIFDNMKQATEKFSSFAQTIDQSMSRNEENFDALLKIGDHVKKLSDRLDRKVFPAFQDSVEQISSVFDRDFNRVASKIVETAEALGEASSQARDSLKHFGSVAEKVNEGKGLLGKLINEDETYRDLKVATKGIKNYFSRIDQLQVIFDSHFETMHRPAETYRFEDSKGYFDVRIHPNDDYFYLLQLAATQKGFITRKEVHKTYCDDYGNVVDTNRLELTDRDKLRFVYRKKKEKFKRNEIRLGFQFGKIFGPLSFRFGLFEGFAGLGADFEIPLGTDKFRWVTSLEGFDFSGWNRKEDRRPHLKWINRIYIMRNIYTSFGADDFISKHNANAFFGVGIRFGDDNVKYFASSLGGGGLSSVQ